MARLQIRIETYGLEEPRDLLEKLKRDRDLLYEEVTKDRFFNFLVTGYSIVDWVKNDPSTPSSAKLAVSKMYDNKWIKICRDLANASKHFVLRWDEVTPERAPVVSAATSDQGFGVGRFGKGAFGVGEEYIEIVLNDGTSCLWPEFVQGIIRSWASFFQAHGL